MSAIEMQDSSVEFLHDVGPSGKERDWVGKKVSNGLTTRAYESINPAKADRLRRCASYLVFAETPQGRRLVKANFCRVRLCPVCSWRWSMKTAGQMREIMNVLYSEGRYAFIMLTLTQRTVAGDELGGEIDRMMEAWRRSFAQNKKFKKHVKGWYRALEITHDVEPTITEKMYRKKRGYLTARGLAVGDVNPNYDMFHPHFHVILAVEKSFFDDVNRKATIMQSEWVEMWAKAMKLDYLPSVFVKRVKGDWRNVEEATKYPCKSGEYLVPDDWELTIETVRILDAALHKRRLISFGGIMKEIRKQRNMDDIETGDLVNVDGEAPLEPERRALTCYVWNSGYNQYVREYELESILETADYLDKLLMKEQRSRRKKSENGC